MTVIRVFEYTHLAVGNLFTENHFEQIVKYNEMHGNKYFNIGNKRVYFKNYVGVLQVGNLTIEILPKADKSEGEEGKNKWHNALVYMLHICGHLNIDSITQADLQIQKLTLIDLFFKVFLAEVEAIVHQGLVRQYRYNTDNRNFLKGRLVFNKHIAKNYLHKEKFFTTAQVYDHDNTFNQILFKALKILKQNTRNSQFQSEACGLLYYFDAISEVHITDSTFDSLEFNRNTAKYEKAVTLARLIIQNHSPDTKTGANPVIGLLFDMNALYEQVVYRILKKQEPRYQQNHLKLSSQYSKKFWNSRTIRPDILGEFNSSFDQRKHCFIIDTKWKRPYDGNPSDDDLKQMFAYNVHFGAYTSILVYPQCDQQASKSDAFYDSVSISHDYKKHTCATFYIQIFDQNGNLRKDAGIELLNSILAKHLEPAL